MFKQYATIVCESEIEQGRTLVWVKKFINTKGMLSWWAIAMQIRE